MTDDQLAEFLTEHPDWYPALFLSLENDRILCFGVYGPSQHFFNFSSLRKFLQAKCLTKKS